MNLSDRDKKSLNEAKQTRFEIDEIKRLKTEDFSIKEIAIIMDLPEGRIRNLVKRYGIN